MKLRNIFSVITGMLMAACLTGCDGEKDINIIEGDLPIKTSTLYMVGDATPNGWSIDNPTPFTATEEDPLVITWEGSLYAGEMKLCLVTGSYDAPFIRPENNGEEISKTNINNQKFAMWAGAPDNKWRVAEAGKYRLTFDLRNWTISTTYLGENDAPEIEPIEAENLYIVGDATPNGWNIDSPTQLEKKSDYVFTYEGPLTQGDFKACMTTGSWDVQFVRPEADGCKISKSGVESSDFVYTTGPDNKWRVEDAGNYRITFHLDTWTVEAEYISDIEVSKDPIETETLFMIGDATPGGWSMDDATEFTKDSANKYIFTWTGTLVPGNMKACLQPDGTFSCPFLRPSTSGVEISSVGVAASDFVYTTNPDDQWKITEGGTYRITFDLEHWTIKAEKLD